MAPGRRRQPSWLALTLPVVAAAEVGGDIYLNALARHWPGSPAFALMPIRNASMAIALALVGVVGSMLSVLVHELGHALAAHCAGERVTHLSVGMGLRVVTLHVWGTEVQLHAAPAGGLTLHAPGIGLTTQQRRASCALDRLRMSR